MIATTGAVPQDLEAPTYPSSLSAAEDDLGARRGLPSAEAPTLADVRTLRGLRLQPSRHPVRDALEWLVIGAAALQLNAPKLRRLVAGGWGRKGQELVGTKWELTLSVGRERGTWMPPTWAISGRRLILGLAVELQEGGVVQPLAIGAFANMQLRPGTWSLDEDTLRLNLGISGIEKGDITLPEGKLYFKTLAWGDMVSSNRGRLLLKQRRALVRQEWRSVGTFKAQPLVEEEGQPLALQAMRIKQGSDSAVPYQP